MSWWPLALGAYLGMGVCVGGAAALLMRGQPAGDVLAAALIAGLGWPVWLAKIFL